MSSILTILTYWWSIFFYFCLLLFFPFFGLLNHSSSELLQYQQKKLISILKNANYPSLLDHHPTVVSYLFNCNDLKLKSYETTVISSFLLTEGALWKEMLLDSDKVQNRSFTFYCHCYEQRRFALSQKKIFSTLFNVRHFGQKL